MGMLLLAGMFLVPAYIALNGMFGESMMDVIYGKTEDRVKYVRDTGPAKKSTPRAKKAEPAPDSA